MRIVNVLKLVGLCLILFLIVDTCGFGDAAFAADEINWQVISSGGSINASSTDFKLSSTLGETATGKGSSDNFGVLHGFLQNFVTGIAADCGDVNEDGAINIKDITYLIKYKYKGGPAPIPLECVGDVNNDDSINIKDITDLIKYKYKGGSAPDENCCNPVW
jgi:hypothetical protein